MGGAQQHNGAEVGQDVNVEDPHLQEGDYGDERGGMRMRQREWQ